MLLNIVMIERLSNQQLGPDVSRDRLQELRELAATISAQIADFQERLKDEEDAGDSPEWRAAYSIIVHELSHLALKGDALMTTMVLLDTNKAA